MDQCPRCHSQELKALAGVQYCDCGWSTAAQEAQSERELNRRSARLMGLIGGTVIAAFALFAFATLPQTKADYLQLKHSVVGLTAIESVQMADICEAQENTDCVQTHLRIAALGLKNDNPLKVTIAKRLSKSEAHESATELYLDLMTDLEIPASGSIYLDAAQSLAAAADLRDVEELYREAIFAKEKSLNITAAQGLIEIFVLSQNKKKALRLVKEVRKQAGPKSKLFANQLKIIRYM